MATQSTTAPSGDSEDEDKSSCGAGSPSSDGLPSASADFSFAYRDPGLSDRILILETTDDELGAPAQERIPINRAILAFKSPYFLKMFTSGMSESVTPNPVVIKLASQREKSAFVWMLHFIYVTSFSEQASADNMGWEELTDLLAVADQYQVPSMIPIVANSLRGQFESLESLQKCMFDLQDNLLQYAEVKSMAEDAQRSLLQKFKEVSGWGDATFISGLRLGSLRLLLGYDALQCSSEEEVFEQTLKWVQQRYQSA